jgi:hypothetical protein
VGVLLGGPVRSTSRSIRYSRLRLLTAEIEARAGTAFSVSPCARRWRGETVRTVRIVRARDSPLCSNGFASCPAVDGRRTQWMVLPGTVRGNHLKSNGGALADGADANIGRRSGQRKITTPPGPGGHKRG